MLGTIEPRKNHKLILELWLELHGDLGPSTPHLLVIGERGWKSGDVIDLLERSTLTCSPSFIRRLVESVPCLSSRWMVQRGGARSP